MCSGSTVLVDSAADKRAWAATLLGVVTLGAGDINRHRDRRSSAPNRWHVRAMHISYGRASRPQGAVSLHGVMMACRHGNRKYECDPGSMDCGAASRMRLRYEVSRRTRRAQSHCIWERKRGIALPRSTILVNTDTCARADGLVANAPSPVSARGWPLATWGALKESTRALTENLPVGMPIAE